MVCKGNEDFLHYLDGLFFCSLATSSACREALRTAVPLCAKLNLPIAPDKLVGTLTSLAFLGFEIDSIVQEL